MFHWKDIFDPLRRVEPEVDIFWQQHDAIKGETPDDIQATLAVTMSVAEFRDLRALIVKSRPGWPLTQAIQELIAQAEDRLHYEHEQSHE